MASRRSPWIATLALVATAVFAAEPPPVETYGALPQVDMLEISPDGTRIARRIVKQGRDLVIVQELATGQMVSGANAEEVNPRWLNFVDNDHLVMVASAALLPGAVGSRFEYSSAFSLDLNTGDIRKLLDKARGLYPYQGGLGRIIGRSPGEPIVYMPAYASGEGTRPYYVLYAASLDKRRVRTIARGTAHTRDWFLDESGREIVREDFNDRTNLFQVWALNEKGRTDRVIYEEETDRPPFSIMGVTPARDALVILADSAETDGLAYFLMSIANGEITGPILERDGLGVERVIMDIDRVVHGVEFEGFLPAYAFFDETLDKRVATILRRLPDTSARLVSWSSDFNKLVFEVSGGSNSGAYLLFEEGEAEPTMLAQIRPDIAAEHVATTKIISYEARDGLAIPALVTGKKDVLKAGDAPLIVMPHGGPESHDRFVFDWQAQVFASRGYVVLQPQFRGSTGFGSDFLFAGRGQWGKSMQTDLDDGVRHLVNEGTVDPARVCIVGASYGGYAALAAGAFSPDMYRCVVAVAPVTDLRRMLRSERSDHGSRHWVIDYWEELYGAEVSEKDVLRSISPALHAEKFEAPVLLIHGKKDTVVTIEQSKVMHKALQKANKDVTFIQLEGEDHWLTQAETRLETLQAMAEFIDEHL
ncbi:MAG: prolyl oligopeptidase family serine peptidase [Pseudomonadota bacterium]